MRVMLIGLALALGGCSDVLPFECATDAECQLDDEQGTCTDFNLCAFPDETCPGPDMLRYDDAAGELAGVCVGDEQD